MENSFLSDPKSSSFSFLLLTLAALTAFGPLSIDMYLPAFSLLSSDLQVPVSQIQFSLTAFFFGLAIGQVIYGPFLDRYGRKPPVLVGLGVYILASAACAQVSTVEQLYAARFLQALGACSGMVASRTIVRDLFSERKSAQVFSLLMLVMGAGPILAPLFGGFLTKYYGWKSVFWVLTGLSAGCWFVTLRFLPESRGPNPNFPLSSAFKNYLGILRGGRFTGFAVAGGLSQGGMFAYITGSPFVLIELFKIPAENYGWIFGTNVIGMIFAAQVNAHLLKTRFPEQILKFSFYLLALAGLMIPGSIYFQLGLFPFLLSLFLFMSALGMTVPNTAAAALAAEGARAGSASALLGTIQFTCAVISSSLVSSFDNGTAFPMTMTISTFGITSLAVFSLTMMKLRRKEALTPLV